jgi:hypothetical protein
VIETANPPAPAKGEPPKAAEVAANGKSEREILLERQNTKQKNVIKKLADGKRTAEEKAAGAHREAERLKQIQMDSISKSKLEPEPTEPEPMSWGFFKG